MSTLVERVQKENPQLFAEEGALLSGTELICEIMERECVSRSQLAKKMGCARSYITNMLHGDNLTLRQLARVFFILGYEFSLTTKCLTPIVKPTTRVAKL